MILRARDWSGLHSLQGKKCDIIKALDTCQSGWVNASAEGVAAEKTFCAELVGIVTNKGFVEMDSEFRALAKYVASNHASAPTSPLLAQIFAKRRRLA